jgi:hypothetical protein
MMSSTFNCYPFFKFPWCFPVYLPLFTFSRRFPVPVVIHSVSYHGVVPFHLPPILHVPRCSVVSVYSHYLYFYGVFLFQLFHDVFPFQLLTIIYISTLFSRFNCYSFFKLPWLFPVPVSSHLYLCSGFLFQLLTFLQITMMFWRFSCFSLFIIPISVTFPISVNYSYFCGVLFLRSNFCGASYFHYHPFFKLLLNLCWTLLITAYWGQHQNVRGQVRPGESSMKRIFSIPNVIRDIKSRCMRGTSM